MHYPQNKANFLAYKLKNIINSKIKSHGHLLTEIYIEEEKFCLKNGDEIKSSSIMQMNFYFE